MKNQFIKVHQTAFRVRYKFFLLKEDYIDEEILKNYFKKINDIKSIRINKQAFSIIFELKNDITTKMRLGEDLPEVAKRKIQTLNEVAKIFFDEKELHNKQNKKTRARVEKHIQETLGDMPLNKITREQISKIQKDKSNELSPASVNFIMGQLNAIFIWAIKQELMDKNPCIHLKNIRVNNTRLRYLELEEIKTLKERLRDNKSAYYFVLLGLSTGGRLQTLCNIKIKDFKEDGMIKLYDFKNESEYYGFIDKSLYDEINSSTFAHKKIINFLCIKAF